MPCGCVGEACVCYMTGDAYTGGGGGQLDPFTVENIPFAPTSPNNSIVITPGGVKNHSPGLDVRLSADAGNSLEYRADGLFGTGGGGSAGPQIFTTGSDTIVSGDGELVLWDFIGLGQTLTLPPAVPNERYRIHNVTQLTDGSYSVDVTAAGGDVVTGDAINTQASFSLPPGYSVDVECMISGIWEVSQTRIGILGGAGFTLPPNPYEGMEIDVRWCESVTTGDGIARAKQTLGIWVVDGSGEVAHFTDQGDFTTSTAFIALPNAIDIDVEIAGTYDVSQQARMYVFRNATVDRAGFMSFQAPGVVNDIQNCARSKGVAAASVGGPGDEDAFWLNTRRVAITGPGVVEALYRTLGAPGVTFQQRRQMVRPVSFA